VLVDLTKRRNQSGKKLPLTPQKRQQYQIQVEAYKEEMCMCLFVTDNDCLSNFLSIK